MDMHSADTDQKERRDEFFCQLAVLCFEEGQSYKEGWVLVPAAALKADYREGEVKHFLERLIEDGWIEVKDQARVGGMHARLTSAGRARAQVICKDAPFTR